MKTRTAYEVVASALRRQILEGTYPPGTKLPTDAELRAEFGVGQSTIREALRILASEHLVKSVRGVNGGTFSTIPTIGHMGEQLEVGMTLLVTSESISITDLMEIRHITEVPAAGYAAARRTEEDIKRLRAAHSTHSTAPPSFADHSSFHRQIVEAANNTLLEVITIPLFRALHNIVGEANAATNVKDEVLCDHHKILTAIADRDSMEAMQHMRKHLDFLSDYYKSLD